ncbi:hypothetical protein BDB01DRAFT_841389 [Pilobolus umbonatus]|nr:hypothetical protein BDB01DRAFT_841389 [Pilobolus umbonatus]
MAVIEEIPDSEKNKAEEEPVDATSVMTDEDGDVFYESIDYQKDELKALLEEATENKLKGNTHFGQGEYDMAIEEYQKALSVCPLSLSKERSNEYKEARNTCQEALKLNPTYTKALLRKAQANERIATSSSYKEALEDYQKLRKQSIDSYTTRECQRAEKELPLKITMAAEKEKEEMMGKLKDLGNTLLGKFGLSTDNFQLQKDESSGGYSMNFVNKP